ncbi:MAG: bile acid:sodium symporter family protein [Clostridium sp.]|nr:bile acid:sodium symporter family protein [Clostridium sp. DSM 8431]MCR4944509.1 bile acid:sodium symporter family protein [Clostridium sp.]
MIVLKKVSKFLSNKTSVFVIAVAVIAFICPDLFSWVKGTKQSTILGIIMLGMGMTLTKQDFKILAERPLDIFIGACAQYTIMPLIAFTIANILGLPTGIGVGLILVGCCPGGVSSNIMSFLCKGDVAFSVGMTTASTILSPVLTPFLVLQLVGEQIEVQAFGMFKSILIVTILPIAIGFICNLIFDKKESFKDVKEVMPGISVIGLALIVGGVIALQGSNFVKSGLLIFLAIFLHNSIGYLLGYGVGILTRMSDAKRRTISIEVGMQNAGLATNLATAHFGALPEAAIASAVSCVWHSITGTLLAGLFIQIDNMKKRKMENLKNKAA